MLPIADIQSALADHDLDGWLFTCFQQNDPISVELLGLEGKFISRRCYYLIPHDGKPRKLVHALEPGMLEHLPGVQSEYLTWKQHQHGVEALIEGCRRLAAQYSPNNMLPSISRLDAGTAELLAGRQVELLSSAELVQRFAAIWSEAQLAGHRRTCARLHEIAKAAFEQVTKSFEAGTRLDEYAVQRYILERFEQGGLWSETDPIVAVNRHSADPHYVPGPEGSSPIRRGDFLLIDLWAKEKRPGSVYADITWCAVCAIQPQERQEEIFNVVANARDAALNLVRDRFPHRPVRGYEVDDAARGEIAKAGYGDYFIHRTGHSIGISDHGHGANMDNLETHDTRLLLPMTGFSIEPGIYFPGEFGVRSEINVALTPEGAEVTGAAPQKRLLRLLA